MIPFVKSSETTMVASGGKRHDAPDKHPYQQHNWNGYDECITSSPRKGTACCCRWGTLRFWRLYSVR